MPGITLADAGYKSESNFEALENKNIKALVSIGREGKTCGSIGADKKFRESGPWSAARLISNVSVQ